MRTGVLTRFETGKDGTFSRLVLDSGFTCFIVEKAWADVDGDKHGDKNTSCVDAGKVRFWWRTDSPLHGECYEAVELPGGRKNVQIHSANWEDQLLGCLAPGKTVEDVKRPDGSFKRGVTASKATLAALNKELKGEGLELDIKWQEGVGPA